MKTLIATLVFVAFSQFSFWVMLLLLPAGMFWWVQAASLLFAAAAVFWVWRKIGDAGSGILTTALTTALTWAAVAGALGFCGGFFGPLIFTPGSEQGPLLGIFIGQLGFIGGGIAGLIYALWRKSASAR